MNKLLEYLKYYNYMLIILGFVFFSIYMLFRFRPKEDFNFITDMTIKSALFFIFIILICLLSFILLIEKKLDKKLINKDIKNIYIINILGVFAAIIEFIKKCLKQFEQYGYYFEYVYYSIEYLIKEFLDITYYNPNLLKNKIKKYTLILIFVYVPRIIISYYLINDFFIENKVSTLYNVLPLMLLPVIVIILLPSLQNFCKFHMIEITKVCASITPLYNSTNNLTSLSFTLKDEYLNKYDISILSADYVKIYSPGYYSTEYLKDLYDKNCDIINLIYYPLIIICLSIKLLQYLLY